VTFTLKSAARFSDGKPITVDDVIFSLELLRDHGRPNHRHYYSKVTQIERPQDNAVKFILQPDGDREMPLILGLMPILPMHVYDAETFEKVSLEKPVGSGPYTVESVDPGARIVYRRNPDYWARELAPNVGRHNFDAVRYDYFRDANSAFEAFTKGLIDLRGESDPTRWATGYDFPAINDGRIVRQEFSTGLPSGMSAFVFNTRREKFADPRVRRALLHMFDFEWANKSLFHGLYSRTASFYDNSELGTAERPAEPAERALLEAFPDAVLPDILEGRFAMPKSDGTGRNRGNRRIAVGLLKDAGYEIRDGVLVNAETGAPFTFEFITSSRQQERLVLDFARSLKRIGIEVSVRQVDSSQLQHRRQTYDFDMMQYYWFASLSPGNEQTFYWGASGRDNEGTRNYMGASEPAIDAMIAALLAARQRPDFVSAIRALDRVLLSGFYVIPLFHSPTQWVARWTHLGHPEATSLYGYQLDTWWYAENQ
jgi:peptide/nickel transport system substrate-binding protein